MKTHFIAFYSYKGGVGRTLALANIARLLAAEEGKKVVVMDFDLEAPGLDHFDVFRPDGEKRKNKKTYPHLDGFAEYVQSCRAGNIPETLGGYFHPCQGMEGDKGKVYLMPAGRRGSAAHDAILKLDWTKFYAQENGYKLMENLRGHIEDEIKPDYVLMDARTGLSEMGGIATHQLADTVVLLFNLNRQNLEGTQRVHDSLHQLAKPPLTLLAASPIPAMPADKGTPFDKKMKEIRDTLGKAANAEKPIVIAYQPILALEERILVDHQDDPFDYDGAYRALLKLIQKHLNDPQYFMRLATASLQNNDVRSAVETLETGLKDNPDHPELTEFRASLRPDGNSLAIAGQIQQKRVADLSERLGEVHPDTLAAMGRLAETRRAQGDFLGARALQEKALDISLRVLGKEHPTTLTVMNNLASTLSAQGDLPGARILEEKALDISRHVLGVEHPDTLASMNNLAVTLQEQGDLSGARALQENALDICRRVLGEEHPNTLTAMGNLASTLKAQGDLPGARVLEETELNISRRVLGEEHPATLTSMNNLAETLNAQGDLPGARALQEKALNIKCRVLGETHPDTSISAFNLLATLRDMGEAPTATNLYRDHLAWLLERDPANLGAIQNDIRTQLGRLYPRKGDAS
ncbi:MAG: tetratricopeptide repeat protein [Sulfuricella sp.]|nr:tetratricopeptide repeat protein [Sulfuricella sp.]